MQIYSDFEKVKQILLSQGFEFLESYSNYDTYFTSLPKQKVKQVAYKELLDNSLIIRNIKSENLDIKNIVYKRKTLDEYGNVTNEIKTKLKIDDIEKTRLIFSNMGLYCWCDYVNQNNEYKKGEITLNLQYVANLGIFVEIEEFESIKDKTDAEKFAILKGIINSFNLPIGNDYSCKNPFMFLSK